MVEVEKDGWCIRGENPSDIYDAVSVLVRAGFLKRNPGRPRKHPSDKQENGRRETASKAIKFLSWIRDHSGAEAGSLAQSLGLDNFMSLGGVAAATNKLIRSVGLEPYDVYWGKLWVKQPKIQIAIDRIRRKYLESEGKDEQVPEAQPRRRKKEDGTED